RKADPLSCQTLFELADFFFHLLAWLEGYDEFLGHIHTLTGSGVASLAGRTSFDLKHAKIAELDPPFLDQSLDDGVERLLDDLLRLELRHADLFRNRFDDLFLGHVASLRLGGKRRRCRHAGPDKRTS